MAAKMDRRSPPGGMTGPRKASFSSCGAQEAFAVTSLRPLRRMSDAAEKAAEARHSLSGTTFELNPIMLEPVKRLSEELANALKSRNSWTASVAPFPNAMRGDHRGPSLRNSIDASSTAPSMASGSSSKAQAHGQEVEVVKGKENQEPQEQQHSYNPNPWYSLLSCRLLSFIGTGGQAPAEHEEVRNAARTVVSSHRLSAERRFSESSMHSIRSFSLDGGDSPSMRSARNSMTRRRLPSNLRRTAHEFAREGAYDRDTSFYSEMAVEAPQTSIRGLSTSLDRSGDPRLSSADGKGVPLGQDEEAELEKLALKRRREAVREAWRRSASTDVATPSMDLIRAAGRPGLPTVPSMARAPSLDDFTNEELVRRNDIFQGRL